MVEVYLDLPLLGGITGWIQDTALLWMIAQITAVKTKKWRLLAGGAVGGMFQFFLLINQVSNGVVNGWVLSPLIFMVGVPVLMIGLTFFSVRFQKTFSIFGYFYLISFLLSGIHWGIDAINQRFFQIEITWWWRFWLHLTLIFILGEIGWGIIHRKIWDRVCLYPIEIVWGENNLRLTALLDTGNRLYDPLTKLPVVIIEVNQIKPLLPLEVVETVNQMQWGDYHLDLQLPGFWEERIRILPFNTIGKEHGILVGFRPDRLVIHEKQKEIVNHQVVIGLSHKNLSPEGTFQALIPPSVLKD